MCKTNVHMIWTPVRCRSAMLERDLTLRKHYVAIMAVFDPETEEDPEIQTLAAELYNPYSLDYMEELFNGDLLEYPPFAKACALRGLWSTFTTFNRLLLFKLFHEGYCHGWSCSKVKLVVMKFVKFDDFNNDVGVKGDIELAAVLLEHFPDLASRDVANRVRVLHMCLMHRARVWRQDLQCHYEERGWEFPKIEDTVLYTGWLTTDPPTPHVLARVAKDLKLR